MERKFGGFLFAWSLILVLVLHPIWLVLGNMEGWLFYAHLLVFWYCIFVGFLSLSLKNLSLILVFAIFVVSRKKKGFCFWFH